MKGDGGGSHKTLGARRREGASWRCAAGSWLLAERPSGAFGNGEVGTASVATSVDTWQRLRRAALSSPHVCTQVMSKTTRIVLFLCVGGGSALPLHHAVPLSISAPMLATRGHSLEYHLEEPAHEIANFAL